MRRFAARIMTCGALLIASLASFAADIDVSIASPATHSRYLAPGKIALVAGARANVAGRSIVRVEFFKNNTTLIGSATTAPWTLTWPGVPIGNYSITARATDSARQTQTSAAIAVHVRKNAAPTVTIDSPKNRTRFFSPATFDVTAVAQDKDDAIAKVEFYQNGSSIGTATTVAYTAHVQNLPQGDYAYTAVATDDLGASKTSTKVVVLVRDNVPPKVRITAPANDSSFVAPATIRITVRSRDADNPISQVQIFVDGRLLATPAAPYQYSWSPVWPGDYDITAKATDSLGAVTFSDPITVHVNPNPTNVVPSVSITSPAANAVFTSPAQVTVTAAATDSDDGIARVDFLQDGNAIGSATSAPYSVTLSGLAFGTYSFTAVATDLQGATTTSAPVSIVVNQPPTVAITSPSVGTVVLAPGSTSVVADAGDVDGNIARVDFYRDGSLIGTASSAPYSASLANLSYGTYVLTAVATDNRGAATTSQPVTFTVNQAPSVAITAPSDNTLITAPGTVALVAEASDVDGSIAKVEFFRGTTSLGTANATPYTASVSGLASGTYTFTAVATDDRGASTTSAPIHAIVNTPPTVTLTSPANNAIATAPANFTLSAAVSDTDGSIDRVEFYQGTTPVGTDTTAPYSANVSALAAGRYTFTAKAFDNRGASATSAEVRVTVSAPSGPVAGNVVKYDYDLVGNITKISRPVVGGLAISGFDPVSGPVGSTVVISGGGFDATAANNVVKFNGTPAVVDAAAPGALGVTVPSGATTGKISVAVGSATATSTRDFAVTIPGAPTITTFTPTIGAAGTVVTVNGSGFDSASATATTVKLNGVSASVNVASSTSLMFTVPPSAGSGAITIATSIGSAASAQDLIVAPSGVSAADIVASVRIVPAGSTVQFSLAVPMKSVVILFDGAADTYYSMQFDQLTVSPSTASVSFKVYKPDNTLLSSGSIGNYGFFGATIHLPKLPGTGTYAVVLGSSTATVSAKAGVAADPIVAIDGAGIGVAFAWPSHTARFVFDAAANQHLGIGAIGTHVYPFDRFYLSAFKPDGSPLEIIFGGTCFSGQSCGSDLTTPAAGRYTLIAKVSAGNTFDTTIFLSSDVTGTLSADTPQTVALTRPGQDARFTFNATAGDSLALNLLDIHPQPSAEYFTAGIYRPDGSYMTQCYAFAPYSALCEMAQIGATGNYVVTVVPDRGAYGDFKLILKKGALIQAVDAPSAFATSIPGESLRLRFAASPGDRLTVAISGLSITAGNTDYAYLSVYAPNGSLVGGATCYRNFAGGSCKATLGNLPMAGTYAIDLPAPAGATMAGNATLSADIAGTLAPGVAQSINASRAGQNARFTFSATAGQSTSIMLYGVMTTPADQTVYVTIFAPNGARYNSSSTSSGRAVVNAPSLPSTGTYTVLVEPAYGTPWAGLIELEPGAALTIGGPLASLVSPTAGRPLRFVFNGTAGQRVDLGISGLAYGSASSAGTNVDVYRADGSGILGFYPSCVPPGSCEGTIASLPATETYVIHVTPPPNVSIAGGSVALSTPLAGTFNVGDPPQGVAIDRPGQIARYTFTGAAGQLLRLTWTAPTIGGGASVAVDVLNPDGSTLTATTISNALAGTLDIPALPSQGTYTVVFDPAYGAAMSANVSLVAR